jgi:LysM repeat protein
MMKNLNLAIASGVLLLVSSLKGQSPNPVIIEYINSYRELAISEMQRTGVPAAIKLAQGIVETEAGKSDLVRRSNNHFGIKCKSWWTGEKVYHDDDASGECFRKYATAEDSYKDHSNYLRSQPRYASLFKLNPEDFEGWAWGLKKAGYATNPRYSQLLIKYIKDYQLEEYTLIGMGKKPLPGEIASNQKNDQDKPVFIENISTDPKDNNPNKTETKELQQNEENPEKFKKPVYPEGEFRINDTRVIFAKAGTSLLSVAQQYSLRLNLLLDFNDLRSDTEVLNEDQLIFLQRKRKQGHNEYHVVREGEDLYDICQEEALRLESLLRFNQLVFGMNPAVGEKLYLRHASPGRPRLALREALEDFDQAQGDEETSSKIAK